MSPNFNTDKKTTRRRLRLQRLTYVNESLRWHLSRLLGCTCIFSGPLQYKEKRCDPDKQRHFWEATQAPWNRWWVDSFLPYLLLLFIGRPWSGRPFFLWRIRKTSDICVMLRPSSFRRTKRTTSFLGTCKPWSRTFYETVNVRPPTLQTATPPTLC